MLIYFFFCFRTLHQNQDHRQIMWALVFYLLEHVEEQIADAEIVPNVLEVVLILLSQNTQLSRVLHNTLLQVRSIVLTQIHSRMISFDGD